MQGIVLFLKNKKNLVSLAVLLALVFAIPLGIYLARNTQIFRPKAEIEGIISLAEGDCVKTINGEKVLTCKDVPLKLINPFGSPAATSSTSPSPSASSSASPSPSPVVCDPKKFDENTWSKTVEACNKKKQRVIYSCQDKTKTKKQKCEGISSNGDEEASKSGKIKCSKKDKKAGTCPSPSLNFTPAPNCNDKKDNDYDGKIDIDDPDCHTDGNPDSKKSYDKSRWEILELECSDTIDNDSDGNIDTADPGCHSDANAQNSASYDPGLDDESRQAVASPPPEDIINVSYRLAETEVGLGSSAFTSYTQNPTLTIFQLSDENPGSKQIWVEFKNDVTGENKIDHITTRMINTKPRIQSADCTLDINKQDFKVTLSGIGFGDAKGKLKSDQTDVDILTWNETQVTGLLKKPNISSGDGKSFKFSLTRGDGLEHEGPVVCAVDTSMLALGARLFCRDQGNFDVPNVKIIIKDQNNNSIEESVTISRDGLISGLKTKLQSGKPYILSIKAPNSLRRNVTFRAGNGTTFVSREDGSPVILPIGDIAPVILPDGKINTLDRAEIVRQWSVLGKGTASTGDFNKDSRVNSIDWACMRYDFNQGDESVPDASILLPTPTPTPTPSQATIPTPRPSSVGSPSPSASSQRAAYFLPEASGSGTYSINSEFAVDINIWSQNEAANLFSAQMSFDATALEVVKIDRGTTLTSWTDSSFDNSAGKISLIAGLPSPGLKTVEGNDPLMAKVTFKGKRAGNTTIVMEATSAIYSNSDNTNIISGLISAPVVITQ